MALSIYNTLKRKKEEFKPLKAKRVGIYACGVTVYDDCHIGHARSLYIFEVIKNYLGYKGYKVKFVRNITDIDDKIINRARETNGDWKEIADKYIESYREDLRLLDLSLADVEPRATEHIEAMQKIILSLIEKGLAYEAHGDVYFSINKFKGYGKLSGQSIEQMKAGARIKPGENKKDPLDFALWKKSKQGEPSWPSLWGKGRPGWHIECSAMSSKYLGQPFDIHAGGRDLIFPHHENEIAQSESHAGKPFAKCWIHHGLLTINGQKMAKSLGNFVTIKDFIAKYKDADLLKLFFLSAHYSHPIDYTEGRIEEAKKQKNRLQVLFKAIDRKLQASNSKSRIKENKEIKVFKDKFIKAMDDDFNSAQGLAAIFELVNITNKHIDDLEFIFNAKVTIEELLSIFGVLIKPPEKLAKDLGMNVIEKIKIREEARLNKNYAQADKIRKELETAGIILEDTEGGTLWRRKI